MKYKPMLAQTGNKKDLEKKDYIFEPKLDGIRALCHVNNKLQFFTRTEDNITKQFPELSFREVINAKNCVLDGVIVVYNEQGNPDLQLLQGRDQLVSSLAIRMRVTQHPATYVVFDILEKNGKSLLQKPLGERKKILEATVKNADNIQIIPYMKNGNKLWNEILQRNIEGVIAKEINSLYETEKQSASWLKIKSSKP